MTGTPSTMRYSNSSGSYYCSNVIDDGGGYYNCTFNTSSLAVGWYNLTMNYSRQHYNANSTTKTSAFFIETAPRLAVPNISKTLGGWGETYIFSVNVSDEDSDNVRVYAWYRKLPSGAWTQIGSYNQTSGMNKTVTFTTSFQFTDMGNLTFKFNVTDDADTPVSGGTQYTDEIQAGFNFTLEADDVTFIYVAGNETTINRVGANTATFTLSLYDTDVGAAVTMNENGTFWVTTNESDPNSWRSATQKFFVTTLSYDFNPDCNYQTGKQKWKGGLISGGSGYYKNTNSSIYNVTITSEYTPYIYYPKGRSFDRDNLSMTITLSMNLTDNEAACGLVSGATVMFNVTNTSYVRQATDYGTGWYNYTIPQTDFAGWSYGWYTLQANATRQYYPTNVSTTYPVRSILHRGHLSVRQPLPEGVRTGAAPRTSPSRSRTTTAAT